MSWLWGKKAEEPQVTPIQEQRKKQIDSLKQQHRKLIEVSKDASYRLPFSVGAQTFFLDITLPPMFPRDAPLLKLVPRGSHPWVMADGAIVCQKLYAFSMHSDLGRLVGEIIEEFQRNPPLVPRDIPPPDDGMGGSYQRDFYPNFPGASRPANSPTLPPKPLTAKTAAEPSWTAVKDSFPDLQSMSATQLQSILDSDDGVILDKVQGTVTVISLQDEITRLKEANKRLAQANMSRRPQFEQKKSELFDKFSLAGEKRQQFDELQKRQEETMRGFDPNAVQERIRIAATKAETEAETMAEDFVNGGIDLETFLPRFLEKRKVAHTRRVMEDVFAKQAPSLRF